MERETAKPEKPSILVDVLVSAWIVFIAVMYYGGYFDGLQALASTGIPVGPIGQFMSKAWRIYEAVMLLAVVAVLLRYSAKRTDGQVQVTAGPVERAHPTVGAAPSAAGKPERKRRP